jgi:hypothetical protein
MKPTMDPYNVDICVTCISDKPPQLPLREELNSLGIEVIYNAHGVGARASKHESETQVKNFREKELKNPHLLSQGSITSNEQELERKRQEDKLRIPTALSYQSYERQLGRKDSTESSSSGSSWDTASSSGTSAKIEKLKKKPTGWGRFKAAFPGTSSPKKINQKERNQKKKEKKPPMNPPMSIDVPTPEEMALKEAFAVFANLSEQMVQPSKMLETERTPSAMSKASTPSEGHSSSNDPSTLTTKKDANKVPAKVEVVASAEAQQTLHGLQTSEGPSHSISGRETKSDSKVSDVPSATYDADGSTLSSRNLTASQAAFKVHSSPEVRQQLPLLSGSGSAPEDTSLHSRGASVQMRRMDSNGPVREFFDLTDMDDGNGSFECESPSFSKDMSTPSSKRFSKRSGEIQVSDSYENQQQVQGLNTEFPEHHDKHGPLVINSPRSRVRDTRDDSPLPPLSPRSNEIRQTMSPRQHEEDQYFGAPSRSMSHEDGWQDSDRSYEQYEEDYDVVHSPRKSYSQDAPEEVSFFQSQRNDPVSDANEEELQIASPRKSDSKESSASRDSIYDSESHPAYDSEQEFAYDSEKDYGYEDRSPKVSFSHDVEECYHDIKDKSSLSKEARAAPHVEVKPLPDMREEVDARSNGDMREDETIETEARTSASKGSCIDALRYGYPMPDSVAEELQSQPLLAKTKIGDRYPLHAACTREFPTRSSKSKGSLVQELVKDVEDRKDLILAVSSAYIDACTFTDTNGDLPVHLLARQLMEWEAQWYQKVYENAQQENPEQNATSITRLYQAMSQCIDMLLLPIVTNKTLCKKAGSVGRLLPLHIAAIFTVPYNILRLLLEVYPQAASIACDLSGIRTFIPTNSLPLELHDRLSTDFPKWEIEGVSGDITRDISWTQSTLEQSYGAKNCIRRSDLFFAFNPRVTPYRHDTPRIRRIECRIRYEATQLEREDEFELTRAGYLLWHWMCTFVGSEAGDDYVDSVKRVVQSLPHRSVLRLAALETGDGTSIIDAAVPQAAQIIRKRLDEIAEDEVPIPLASFATGYCGSQKSEFLNEWKDAMAARMCMQGRGFVAVMCRTLFNVKEDKFPTSFIFLPYKLVRDEEGRLGLESPKAAEAAIKFADCLLHLTSPEKIIHFLEKKSLRFAGQSLGTESEKTWFDMEDKIKEDVDQLLSLYESGPAYFYFLDEYTGIPIVPEKKSSYPLQVNDPVDMVKKVLPLMISGMILMRGEKAISVIADILLNPHLSSIQKHWVETAKDVAGYMFSPQTEWSSSFVQDLMPLKDGIVDFIERGASEVVPDRGSNSVNSEWVVEISLVRMLTEMHDAKATFAGLKPRRADGKVLWTKEQEFLDTSSDEHLFHYDFKSVLDLKETKPEEDEEKARSVLESQDEHHLSFGSRSESTLESLSDSSFVPIEGYGHLFGDLAMTVYRSRSDDSEDRDNMHQTYAYSFEADEDYIPAQATPARKSKYASDCEPISLLAFDDDLDIDDMLQLRIQMDEQEAKLDFLRDKINDIHDAKDILLEEEERLGLMLDEINNSEEHVMENPEESGLSKARHLLLRICDLEERVLCRAIEVQQLKMDISCFEMEATEGII